MRKLALLALPALLLIPSTLSAAPVITAAEIAVLVDADLTDTLNGDPAPAGVNPLTGLGSFVVEVTGAGTHDVSVFWDLDVTEALLNNGLFDEDGSAVGIAGAGLSWEIDEPGWTFGDIYTNFSAHALDNTGDGFGPEDVSAALSWNFVLAAGETAFLNFVASTAIPNSGFYLLQTDAISNTQIAFYSTIDIRGDGPPPIPEPGTLLLVGSGALAGIRRLRRRTA